ncbi:hypothetical protein [Microbacterium sp. YJN-G]|uniref:hypothetical protein n=1 Tax=Microbacterium sp. YJN-G TaxID=2763257 RepID=UPI00187839C8|nr:hypothetical protein [Microbacterium sp. YJN-G]
MMLTTQNTTDAGTVTARRTTLFVGGGALALCGPLMLLVPHAQALVIVVALLVLAGTVVPAIGLGHGSSVTGMQTRPRVALILVGVTAALLSPVFYVLSVPVMLLAFASGLLHPFACLMILWGLIAVIAIGALVGSVIAGLAIARAGVIPAPWGWLALPALIASIVGEAVKAGIAVVAVLSWRMPETVLYQVITTVQAAGIVVLGGGMILVGLLAYRRTASAG